MFKYVLPIFLLATLFLFSSVLLSGQSLFYYDTISQRLPAMIFFKDEVLSGRFPLWNPYLYAGLPHLADPTNNVLSPFNLFYFLLSPALAINLITALGVFIAGLGMYLFVRALRLTSKASLFAGLAFMFCGSNLTLVNDLNSLLAVSFIPLIFLFFTLYLKTKRWLWFLLTVIAATFQFFSGHPLYIYLTWFFLALFISLSFPKISLKEKLTKIGLVATAFVGLSAVQLLPFLELMNLTYRPSDLGFASNGQFQLVEIPRLVFVNFYGRLVDGTSWGPSSLIETGLGGINGYIGLLSLAFFIMALFFKLKKLKGLFILAFLAFLLSLGTQLPVYPLLHKFLPFFKFFRSLSRILIFWSFFSILIASSMFDQLLKLTKDKENGKMLRLAVFLLASAVICIWQKEWLIKQGTELFTNVYQAVKNRPLDTAIYGKEKLLIIFQLWHENLIMVLFGLASLFFFLFKRRNFYWLIIAFVIFEGLWFGKNELLTVPIEFITPRDEVVDLLKQRSSPYQRVVSTGEIVPFTGLQSYWGHLRSRPPFSSSGINKQELKEFGRFKKEIDQLPANLTENYRLFSPSGYTAVVLKNYADYWDSKVANSVIIPALDDERLSFLGTRYLVTGYPGDFITDRYDHLELEKDFDGVKVYKNKEAFPRAFLVDENGQLIKEAEISSYLPSKVIIKVKADDSARLVLTDSFYPGWKVEIEGKDVEIEPFRDAFRSISIPRGEYEIIFAYTPRSLALGGIISVGTLIGLGLATGLKRRGVLSSCHA